mmetsp:Transcript_30371/g.66509  ORF Transcript_30371/g.66509 Transcript_30371/m.66509 type:complete len:234 (-) Transcript_30371:33-734(-)
MVAPSHRCCTVSSTRKALTAQRSSCSMRMNCVRNTSWTCTSLSALAAARRLASTVPASLWRTTCFPPEPCRKGGCGSGRFQTSKSSCRTERQAQPRRSSCTIASRSRSTSGPAARASRPTATSRWTLCSSATLCRSPLQVSCRRCSMTNQGSSTRRPDTEAMCLPMELVATRGRKSRRRRLTRAFPSRPSRLRRSARRRAREVLRLLTRRGGRRRGRRLSQRQSRSLTTAREN